MNWIKIFKNLRFLFLALFALSYTVAKFNLIENFEIVKNIYLYDLSNICVIISFVFYFKQLQLEIAKKDQVIASLKLQLK